MEPEQPVPYEKRKKLSTWTDDEDPDELNEGGPSRARKGMQEEAQVLFACPYNKRFGPKGGCLNKGWPNTARVKEHLYQHHRQPIHCPRCQMTFKNEDQLETHMEEQLPCKPLKGPPIGGIDMKQLRDLKSRKGLSRMTEDDKWRQIYTIVFPDNRDEIPSPYFGVPDYGARDISKFLDQNLPSLVQEVLERRLATIGHDISREDLVEIVHQAQSQVYRDLNQSYGSQTSGSQATAAIAANEASSHEDDLSWLSTSWPSHKFLTEPLWVPSQEDDLMFDFSVPRELQGAHAPAQSSAGPPARVKSKLSKLDWDSHKAYIQDLYLIQNSSLAETVQKMKDAYAFKATPRVYKDKFKEWGWHKNLSSRHAQFMVHKANDRRLKERKDTIFGYGGQRWDSKRAKNTLCRNKKAANDDDIIDMNTPESITYHTPQDVAEDSQPSDSDGDSVEMYIDEPRDEDHSQPQAPLRAPLRSRLGQVDNYFVVRNSLFTEDKDANEVEAGDSELPSDLGYGSMQANSFFSTSENLHSTEEAVQRDPSNSHNQVDVAVGTLANHELPDSREKGGDDIPYTDSGYDSVPGPGHHLMHEKQPGYSSQAGLRDSFVSSDLDGSDADTSYSDSSTILPRVAADKYVSDIINNVNQRLDRIFDTRTLVSISKRLPALIKAFAVKLGSDKPDRLNLRAMRSVHKHHQYIVSQLETKFHRDDNDAMKSRRLMDAMPLSEIMTLWGKTQDKDLATVDLSECFQGVEDEEDATDDEDAVNEEDVADEESGVFAFSGHERTIVQSAAYEWLISSLVKEISLHWDETQPRTMIDQIGQGILSQLPTGRISSRRPPDRHKVSFKIPKSSLPFIFEDQQSQPTPNPPMIADRIVITSASTSSVQVSKVSQYMDQTWPLGGRTLLSVLQNIIDAPGPARTSSAKEGNCEIEIVLEGFYAEAFVTGTSYSIAEYGEQLAWLTAALQPSVSDLAMYVRPFIRPVGNHTPTRGDINSWVIDIWREEIYNAAIIAQFVQEWEGESRSPVIVRGFPTLSRPENCPGIEVPPELLTSLLPSSLRESKETRFLLGMTGKVLQLFEQTKGVAVWHILGSSREFCGCRQRFLKDNDKESLHFVESHELLQNRHIITECSFANSHHRDAAPQMEPWIGSSDISQRELSILEVHQFTPLSEAVTDSLDSLDIDMLSIPDSSENSASEPSVTDDAVLAIIEEVASRLVSEYRQCTERHHPANECPSNAKQSSPGGQQSVTTHGSSQSTLRLAATQTSSSNTVKKRPAGQDDDDGDDDEASQRRPVRKKQKPDDTGKVPQFFACPFWKQNPDKHRDCYGKKLDMISRVKQHLTRNHHPEFYCERCFVVFPNDDSKQIHLREVCLSDGAAQLDGITSQQQKKLSRKSDKRLSEYEKWFAVWEIVFPGLDRPSSPYLDLELSQDLNHFREFSERRGAEMLLQMMREEGLVTPGGDAADLLVRRVADRAMRSLFDEWMNQRAEYSQNSSSGGSPWTDALGGQQHQGERRERVHRLADLSSNTDSGVELRSYPSSGPSRDGANIPRYPPIRPRPASIAQANLGPPASANLGVPTAGFLHDGGIPWQDFVDPPPIDTGIPDLLTQTSGESHIDPRFLNFNFEEHCDTELGRDFDMDSLFVNTEDGHL